MILSPACCADEERCAMASVEGVCVTARNATMTAHPPPIPPDQQTPHGKSEAETPSNNRTEKDNRLNRNLGEQGRQGNVKQNTTNQGYQQDR
jgi:hypothetical protein